MRYPEAYYDLDQLAGAAADPAEGDEVRRHRTRYVVVNVITKDGAPCFLLAKAAGQKATQLAAASELTVLRRADPNADDRLPARYSLARWEVLTRFHPAPDAD